MVGLCCCPSGSEVQRTDEGGYSQKAKECCAHKATRPVLAIITALGTVFLGIVSLKASLFGSIGHSLVFKGSIYAFGAAALVTLALGVSVACVHCKGQEEDPSLDDDRNQEPGSRRNSDSRDNSNYM